MFVRKFTLLPVLLLCIGLCSIGADDDDKTFADRLMAYDIVFKDEYINVELDRNDVRVGEKVVMRSFVHAPTKISPPRSFGYRVLRIGFYHRRLKRIVFETEDATLVRTADVFGESLAGLYIIDHPYFSYYTATRRGLEDIVTPQKPGAYLIIFSWSRTHPKWGKGELRSAPVILIVRPPSRDHAANTTDPRFMSGETPEIQKELEDCYDHASAIWKKGENHWKR